MKTDILNRSNVEALVNAFYQKVRADDIIGFIFNDIAKVNWGEHLPVTYNFWERVIFSSGNYAGNPMQVHVDLNKMIPLSPTHFRQWLTIFSATVSELFEGKNADAVQEKAKNIATIMEKRISTPSSDICSKSEDA